MLTLDTTGSSLFKRGYRTEKGGAPLKENMAAALVLISHWYPEQTFVDPVCGSGTIPIEAALIGHNIAPGLNRQFACGKWELAETGVEEKFAKKHGQRLICHANSTFGAMTLTDEWSKLPEGILLRPEFVQALI